MRKLLIIFLLLQSINLKSQKAGDYTYSFLSIPTTSIQSGVGGINVSIPNENFFQNNPALLTKDFSKSLLATYNNYFADINNGSVSYIFSESKFGYFATSVNYLNYGEFKSADEYGNITGTFTASDYTLVVSWGYQIDTLFSIGINLKPIFSQYEIYNSIGLANDLGILYTSPNKNFNAGLVFKNIGFQIKPYITGNKERLPYEIQLGITQKLPHSPFRFSVTAHHLNDFYFSEKIEKEQEVIDDKTVKKESKLEKYADLTFRHIVVGAEIQPSPSIFILLGYNYMQRQELKILSRKGIVGYSIGFGLKIKRFSFGYSLAKYHFAANNHIFTIQFKFNQNKKIKEQNLN